MSLTEGMQAALRLAMEDGNLDYLQTVEQAIKLHVEATGEPIRLTDDQEFFELFNECIKFVLDREITNLILNGVMEVKRLEGDEFVYGLTETYKERVNRANDT